MSRRDRSTGRSWIGDLSDPDTVSTLTGWLENSGAVELEIIGQGGQTLKIVLGSEARPAAAGGVATTVIDAEPRAEGVVVKAPIAGRFRHMHPSAIDTLLPVAKGRSLEADSIVAFVEVGPVLLPVTATVTAIVADIHVQPGDLVGYGDAIMTLEPVR